MFANESLFFLIIVQIKKIQKRPLQAVFGELTK